MCVESGGKQSISWVLAGTQALLCSPCCHQYLVPDDRTWGPPLVPTDHYCSPGRLVGSFIQVFGFCT